MRPSGPPERLEARRRTALQLFDTGLSLNEVGRIIGCAPSSVMRWRDARRQGGARALKVRFSPGRPPKLNERQRERLETILRRGPRRHGFTTGAWTTARVAETIRREFGVTYHRDHVGRVLHRLGWSHRRGRDRMGWARHSHRRVARPGSRRMRATS
jgi:transposase